MLRKVVLLKEKSQVLPHLDTGGPTHKATAQTVRGGLGQILKNLHTIHTHPCRKRPLIRYGWGVYAPRPPILNPALPYMQAVNYAQATVSADRRHETPLPPVSGWHKAFDLCGVVCATTAKT